MRYVVPGASGFVGRMLIDILINNKRDVLVIGRNKDSLSKLFRNIDVAGYDEFEGLLKQDDVIVNLAVINNNKHTSLETMRQVNVTLACTLAKAAAAAGATRFVNVSSIHALDPSQSSHYATTKRELVIALEKIQGIEITNLFLPAVHGEKFSGQLAFLNKTPQMISKAVFNIVAAAKPTADIHLVADWLNINPITSEPNVILSDGQHSNPIFAFFKRGIDIAFCLFVIIFFGWLLIILIGVIRATSPGPAIFRHQRVGLNGKAFTCYKLRSMKLNTEQRSTHEVRSDAITPVGKFLRKTKLDELPQIWNILANEMSLIGPRPCLPSQTRLVALRRRVGIDKIKPGISGLAQINGIDMSDPEHLAVWDFRYIQLQSLFLDAKIIVKTALGSGTGDPAQPD